jgi:hypothetical protein
MTMIKTPGIRIELSNEWNVFEVNGRLVGHGPDNTEVIATSTVLTGKGTQSERMDSLEKSRVRTADLMRRNASNPKLVTTVELFEKILASGIRLTQLSSVSTDGAIAFDQFMLAVGNELLFLTYEGPSAAEKIRDFVHAAIESANRR